MSAPQLEILAIAVLAAAGCALVGVFLMLRRLAMLADAISHAILPGIVLAFFLTENLASPWLVIAAAGLLGSGFLFLLTRNVRGPAFRWILRVLPLVLLVVLLMLYSITGKAVW